MAARVGTRHTVLCVSAGNPARCVHTNAIESLNMQLRKIIKTRGHFPNDEAAIKLLWLALRNGLTKSVRAAFDWKSAMNQFAILFGDRFTQARG
jgi:putative transposase